MKKDTVICRCEEITYGEILQAIHEGATTLDGVKRMTRAGKGFCQGRTCRTIISQIIREETGKMAEGKDLSASRPPVRTVTIADLLREENAEKGEETV